MIQAVLEDQGCDSTSFSDPQQALQFLISNPDRVVVLITNFRMPHMSGPELIREALKVNPNLSVIAISGRANEYAVDDLRGSIEKILPKPFLKSEMMEAVISALSKQRTQCPLP